MWRLRSRHYGDNIAQAIEAVAPPIAAKLHDESRAGARGQSSDRESDGQLLFCHLDGDDAVPREIAVLSVGVTSIFGNDLEPTTFSDSTVTDGGRQSERSFVGHAREIKDLNESQQTAIKGLFRNLVADVNGQLDSDRSMGGKALRFEISIQLSYNKRNACSNGPTNPPLTEAELSRIRGYINDHLAHPIELVDLAVLVNLSRSHFARQFKRSTGVTAIKFVEQCRIMKAQSLLVESALPLVEVALMTGFSDQSHFTRRFRLHVGSTPAAFARTHGTRRAARRVG